MTAKTPIEWYVVQKVREKRLERSLTQLQLSLELGYSEGYIGKVESKKLPDHYNVNQLNSLARILKCSLQDFFPKKPL
jgi:transcriptional regulator with XRE-family HTH domain